MDNELKTLWISIDSRYPHTFFEIQHPLKQKSDEFNAIDDLRPLSQKEVGFNAKDLSSYDLDYEYQNQNKKADFKPKYDPGWKFIGLGKRPLHKDYLNAEDLEVHPGKVNPLWGISTLINFEFFNALKDNLENTDKEPVKKGEGLIGSNGISSVESGNQRFNNKIGWYGGGRQKVMYDPGWMLTGLGSCYRYDESLVRCNKVLSCYPGRHVLQVPFKNSASLIKSYRIAQHDTPVTVDEIHVKARRTVDLVYPIQALFKSMPRR